MTDQQPIDLLLHAKWVLPIVPFGHIYEDCSIAVDQGLIVAIVPQAEAGKRFAATEVVNCNEHVALPGLINAHGHSGMSLMRGYADDLPLEQWLQDYIWPAEARWINDEFVHDGCQLALTEMIRAGTTCFADMYFYPDVVAAAAQQTGMRSQINSPILDFPTVWAQNADEYISKALVVHDDFRSSDLVTVGFGPHAPYTVSDAPLKRIAVLAEELQAPIHIHLHETATEVRQSLEQHGRRPIQRIHELGILSPLTQCVHMTQVNADDIKLLHQCGAHVIHCPESNLKLASGFCPVHDLLQAGVNVALGTDSAASNNDLDILGEIHTAALLAKGVAGNAGAVNAHQALRMATLNAAIAMGKEQTIGSLEPGKAADITAIKLDGPNSSPLYNVASHLVYSHNSHRVSDVWVNGKALLRNRQLTTLNEVEILERARYWAIQLNDSAFHGDVMAET